MMIRTRTRMRRVLPALAALVAAASGAAALTTPAAAAGTPRFLAPSELPPHPASAWFAGPVTAGQPDPLPMCVGEALPSTSVHRTYRTDYDTGAQSRDPQPAEEADRRRRLTGEGQPDERSLSPSTWAGQPQAWPCAIRAA
ncbi:hypothetical protein ACFRAO_31435 [Streptomyces sp. NPDC056656]|uniref:hypothetical protein n=1 Tax=Streptomyces sp. NPDC056656 TaxID=3345895 RepID=UPI0036A8FD6A